MQTYSKSFGSHPKVHFLGSFFFRKLAYFRMSPAQIPHEGVTLDRRTHLEYLGRPLPERLLLSAHLVAVGHPQQAFAAQLAQNVVHILTEGAEIWIGRGAEGKNGEPDIGEGAKGLLGEGVRGGAAQRVPAVDSLHLLQWQLHELLPRAGLHEGL